MLIVLALLASQAEAIDLTYADVRYGQFHRNVLDVYLPPNANNPVPAVIYFHGGGWMSGDKSDVRPEPFLSAGMAVISANYRYTMRSPDAAPYPAPMDDAARVVQFVRHNASKWNIDSDRIALAGTSAGAVMAMWVAYQNDMADKTSDDVIKTYSTRVKCVLPNNTPTTLDPEWILANVGGPSRIHIAAYPLFRIQSLDELKEPPKSEMVVGASAVHHITPDDPPTFLRYGMEMTETPLPEDVDSNISIHHPRFGLYLKECCDQAGVTCILRYKGDGKQDSELEFLREHLADE